MTKRSGRIESATGEQDKSARGNASQFFVAGQLCRRGYAAVITLGNTPNTDILCSNRAGTKFIHVQVKTFLPGIKTCSVGLKAERSFGPNFFWILAGIPAADSTADFEYFIIPAEDMACNVRAFHERWLEAPGKGEHVRKDSSVRAVNVPPNQHANFWTIEGYRERWDLIADALDG
jgi:hypothetical protein